MKTVIDVRLRSDWATQELGYRHELSPELARALGPLPRDRELGGWPALEAIQQIERRRMAAQAIAQEITVALMEMVEMQDTRNGYARKEINEAYSDFRMGLRP